jgi:hypothetical protein
MAACQKQQTKRDARKCGNHKPYRAAQMNFLPVLHNDDASDGDRQKYGQWSGYLQWNAESEQGNGNQRLAKTKRRANQRGDKHDGQNLQSDKVDWNLRGEQDSSHAAQPGEWLSIIRVQKNDVRTVETRGPRTLLHSPTCFESWSIANLAHFSHALQFCLVLTIDNSL